MTRDIPILETERLILRGPQESDFELLAAFYASPRSVTVGGPLTRELAWRALAQEAGHWTLRGFGRWTVTERTTGAAVGIVGLWHPEGFPERELGWDLFDGAQGKGYATEAGQAARDHAFETLGWDTLISLVKIGNDASAAVAQRLGAAPDGSFTHARFGTMTIYRHPKEAA
jgi:RimJ/RimL family protein N-acetyltransferase